MLTRPLSTETALERDYFMTGKWRHAIQNVLCPYPLLFLAQEALEFGIVDRVLEKRPKMESI